MKIDQFGKVHLTEEEIFNNLYSGLINQLENIHIDNIDCINQFNQSVKDNFDNFPIINQFNYNNVDLKIFDHENQKNWFIPKEYIEYDIIKYLYDKCQSQEEHTRVSEELTLFKKHNMIDLLKYLKFLVDTMRKNNIVWGVGRGSSVASYILFLIGIHKIDSIKYKLDIQEFLK